MAEHVFGALSAYVFAYLPSGAGSTLLSIVQQVGIGFGIAVSSIILLLYRNVIGNQGEALQQAFSYTFLTSSVFALLLIWVLCYLRRSDGDGLRKKNKKS